MIGSLCQLGKFLLDCYDYYEQKTTQSSFLSFFQTLTWQATWPWLRWLLDAIGLLICYTIIKYFSGLGSKLSHSEGFIRLDTACRSLLACASIYFSIGAYMNAFEQSYYPDGSRELKKQNWIQAHFITRMHSKKSYKVMLAFEKARREIRRQGGSVHEYNTVLKELTRELELFEHYTLTNYAKKRIDQVWIKWAPEDPKGTLIGRKEISTEKVIEIQSQEKGAKQEKLLNDGHPEAEKKPLDLQQKSKKNIFTADDISFFSKKEEPRTNLLSFILISSISNLISNFAIIGTIAALIIWYFFASNLKKATPSAAVNPFPKPLKIEEQTLKKQTSIAQKAMNPKNNSANAPITQNTKKKPKKMLAYEQKEGKKSYRYIAQISGRQKPSQEIVDLLSAQQVTIKEEIQVIHRLTPKLIQSRHVLQTSKHYLPIEKKIELNKQIDSAMQTRTKKINHHKAVKKELLTKINADPGIRNQGYTHQESNRHQKSKEGKKIPQATRALKKQRKGQQVGEKKGDNPIQKQKRKLDSSPHSGQKKEAKKGMHRSSLQSHLPSQRRNRMDPRGREKKKKKGGLYPLNIGEHVDQVHLMHNTIGSKSNKKWFSSGTNQRIKYAGYTLLAGAAIGILAKLFLFSHQTKEKALKATHPPTILPHFKPKSPSANLNIKTPIDPSSLPILKKQALQEKKKVEQVKKKSTQELVKQSYHPNKIIHFLCDCLYCKELKKERNRLKTAFKKEDEEDRISYQKKEKERKTREKKAAEEAKVFHFWDCQCTYCIEMKKIREERMQDQRNSFKRKGEQRKRMKNVRKVVQERLKSITN